MIYTILKAIFFETFTHLCAAILKTNMNTTQQSAKKSRSVISKAIQSKSYIGIVSSTVLHRGNTCFRLKRKGSSKVQRYQNTYHLESYKPFNCENVDKILISVMQNYLIDLEYEPQVCMQTCEKISEEVRDKICNFCYDRYKVVVVISIVQKLGQDVRISFGKLWDVQRDTYSTHVIETSKFIAMGLVVGTYYE